MRLTSLQIQKFRSIDNITVSIDQILAVVGANNTGKSHILRALNAFFNFADEREAFLNHDHMYSSRSRPKITLSFDNIEPDDNVDPMYIHSGKLTVRFTYRWDRKNPAYDVISANRTYTISTEQFDILMNRFRYIYVPVVRNYESAIFGNEGIAYRLLRSTLSQQIANRNTIQPLVDKLLAKVNSTIFTSAIASIKQYYPLKDANLTMRTSNKDFLDVIIQSISLYLSENTQVNEIGNCGSGIQSAVYFAIAMAVSMGNNVNCLVGIEEPELNMHPQAQRLLIESLKNQVKYPKTQFILTTHSTVVIDKLGHTHIALCHKNSGPGRDIVTTVSQIGQDFWDKYKFSEERYNNFYQYKNSDFFFSSYIIITESPTDCSIIAELLSRYHIDIEEVAISLIPADGERSIKYPYAMAKELSIPFLCIVDRDVFQPYDGNSRKESLRSNGIPKYKSIGKTSSPIYDLIADSDLDHLLTNIFCDKYNDVLEILKKYRIISMRYAIEVDMVICPSYCNAICDFLGVAPENRNATYLLTEKSDRIKKCDVIVAAFDSNPLRNLPMSYRRIIAYVREMIEENI